MWACYPCGDGPLQPDLTGPFEEFPVLYRFHPIHCFPDELGGTPVRKALDQTVEARGLFWAKGETSAHGCSTHGWQPWLTCHNRSALRKGGELWWATVSVTRTNQSLCGASNQPALISRPAWPLQLPARGYGSSHVRRPFTTWAICPAALHWPFGASTIRAKWLHRDYGGRLRAATEWCSAQQGSTRLAIR